VLDGDHKALVDAALSVCVRYGLGVAGGYAVKAHGLVERPSEDIDFATGAAAPIEEIVAALDAAYRSVGFEVQVLDAEGRKGHLLVTFPLGGTYRVDVLKEPLNHPVVWMEFGPVIALADAVALKMGALHDRALPRPRMPSSSTMHSGTRVATGRLLGTCRSLRWPPHTGNGLLLFTARRTGRRKSSQARSVGCRRLTTRSGRSRRSSPIWPENW
jgi:hypothetical protein